MSSFANDSAEAVMREWMKRAKVSQREGARMMARFLREARKEQGKLQRTAQEALVSAAGMLRREVDQLQDGLKSVSQRLATFEQQQQTARGRTSATHGRTPKRPAPKRVRRSSVTARKRRSLKKAA